ncbi:hypothetical protein E2C01_061929 [Portunus trituberculatus]|uniref:Uncharacterized protein n=1 Tax=Portunus trituberculatus TaxID=210409 RepID=A0A5B7HCP8_PORTR|nr:hypothetical protein [Portunus trituberculatus]
MKKRRLPCKTPLRDMRVNNHVSLTVSLTGKLCKAVRKGKGHEKWTQRASSHTTTITTTPKG